MLEVQPSSLANETLLCPKCSREFYTKPSFTRHIKWKCIECMQEFCQQTAWSEHMDSAHPSSSGFSKVNHKIKINPKCQSCSGIFLSVQSLDEHFQYFCAICPERFCQKEAWIEHSEQSGHSKKPEMVSARPYLELDNNSGLLNVNNQKPELKCQSCSGSFFGRVTLAKHFKHFCSLCTEKFCKEEEWIQHLSSVHPYYKKTETKCQICLETFDDQLRANHFEHSCDRCLEKFCQKEALIEHFLLAHSPQKSDMVKLQFKQPTPTKGQLNSE